ncbi:hypothetical protein Tco_0649806 [Tanacetum coccineum]
MERVYICLSGRLGLGFHRLSMGLGITILLRFQILLNELSNDIMEVTDTFRDPNKYNMEECYRALIDQIEWTNPKGHKSPVDMRKPLPLQNKEGRLTIPVEFFFNNDLKYLKAGNKERTYSSFITKTPAVRATINKVSKHEVFSTMRILSVVSVQVEKKSGYGYDDIK